MVVKKKGNGGVDLEEIKKFIEILENSSLEEMEISYKEIHLRLKKPQNVPQLIQSPQVVTALPQLPLEASSKIASEEIKKQEKEKSSSNTFEVTSPMVGTFYRAPAPNAEPFVKVGDSVKKGQTLCIIEAMKLMNEIESEVDGKVLEIKVENAQPVEYGEVIMLIDTGI